MTASIEQAKARKDRLRASTLEMLRSAGPNAVVYSRAAWAAARKSSSGGVDGAWFLDCGAHRERLMSPERMSAWTTDWQLLREDEVSR